MIKNVILLFVVFFSACLHLAAHDTITTASGLKYVRKTAGTGKQAISHSVVKVKYRGKLTNGQVFDENLSGKPFKFEIENKEAIPGWDEGVKLMKEGEKGVLIIPAKLAYGKSGVRDPEDESKYIIPPNATLIFEIELLEVR